MGVVVEELHIQIEAVQHKLVGAERSGLSREAYLYRARLEDLVDIAAHHGVDVTAWLDRSLLPPLALAEG